MTACAGFLPRQPGSLLSTVTMTPNSTPGPETTAPCAAPQDELRRYRGELLDAPALVVANKVDALAQPRRALAALKARTHLPIVPVSAQHGAGMEALKEAVRAVVMSAPGAAEGAAVAVMLGGCTQ